MALGEDLLALLDSRSLPGTHLPTATSPSCLYLRALSSLSRGAGPTLSLFYWASPVECGGDIRSLLQPCLFLTGLFLS